MIGWLQGRIVDRPEIGKLVIETQGVGYDVETPLSTFFQLTAQSDVITLHIHTIVREDALLLYGFLDKQERSLFRALIKVSGIGPKSAINILSSLPAQELIQCVQNQHLERLVRVPGVGPKTAARLLIELKDRLEDTGPLSLCTPQVSHNVQAEAIAALEALGYKLAEATKMIQAVDEGQQSCEQLIRNALRTIGRAK